MTYPLSALSSDGEQAPLRGQPSKAPGSAGGSLLASVVIDLISEPMLGHWDVSPFVSQCEYQIEQRLVFVQHPKGVSHLPYIAKTQKTIAETWEDIQNAVRFAEQLSRRLIPDFWKAHDESHKASARFDVYSIHYDIDDPCPTYTVGKSHDFDFENVTYAEDDLWRENPITTELPEPPDNFLVSIRRLGANHFESASIDTSDALASPNHSPERRPR